MDAPSGYIPILLPEWLYEKIQEKIEGTSFSDVVDYIIMKLEQDFPPEDEVEYSEADQELIRDRLRKLGYLE